MIEKNMSHGVPESQCDKTPEKNKFEDQERGTSENTVEYFESSIEGVESNFSKIQINLDQVNSIEGVRGIIKNLTGLFDETINLSKKLLENAEDSSIDIIEVMRLKEKIKSLRDRVHNFLMDEAWGKFDRINLDNSKK